jgi:dienelactone hydrolase
LSNKSIKTGVTVIANGPMRGGGGSQTLKTNMMAQAIDWSVSKVSTTQWAHLDTSKVAAAGQSCGGLEAAVMALDKRVKFIGMFNQGGTDANKKGLPIPNDGNVPDGTKFNVPTFFFAGGPSDGAGQNVSMRFFGARILLMLI